MPPVATFSIVAYDAGRQEWGVAVQSKFMACAAVVSWARANAGAVATQSYANMAYGPDGLELMARGVPAAEAIRIVTEADDDRDQRQVGMIDRQGNAASFTGQGCHDWAGHIVGDGFACQGNILIPGTVEAMVEEYKRRRSGPGELADWLVAALAAGQEAGGDSRGRQAAGVLVVRDNGGYGGNNDRYLDLRVDDDPYPIRKLSELVRMHHLFFGEVDPAMLVPVTDVAREIQQILKAAREYDGPVTGEFDAATRKALRSLVGKENLEERWDGSGDMIDSLVVDYLGQRYGS
ncbi:MAG: DUF1028 domain-containing protein [Chloroflexota bacterium]|jgi:uncharacterized Ntn-hydrolase superfamily protein